VALRHRGLPTLLVIKQPDLGSAMVFITILFAMLLLGGQEAVAAGAAWLSGHRLALAFSTVAWGAWIIVLLALLLWWRPYVWEGLGRHAGEPGHGRSWGPVLAALAPISRTGCSRS